MCSLPQRAKSFPEVLNHDRLLQSFYSQLQTFFKDKGMFFASLITPVILLVLYAAFLANVYRDSFISALPEGFPAAEKLIGGIVGGQLVSSLLAVSCITVSFCCNMTMVLDKVTGARRDLTVSPVKKSTLALSYYLATFASTLLVCLIAAGAGFIYLAKVGWYLSFADVMLLFADIVLLVLFGTALSSIVNRFLTTQGRFPLSARSSARVTVSSAAHICRSHNSAPACSTSLCFCPEHTEQALFAIMPSAVRSPRQRMRVLLPKLLT